MAFYFVRVVLEIVVLVSERRLVSWRVTQRTRKSASRKPLRERILVGEEEDSN